MYPFMYHLFTQQGVSEIHPSCCLYQYLAPFSLLSSIPLYAYFIICLSINVVDTCVFTVSVIITKAAMNVHLQSLCGYIFILSRKKT